VPHHTWTMIALDYNLCLLICQHTNKFGFNISPNPQYSFKLRRLYFQ
jgi:hypothetical protein